MRASRSWHLPLSPTLAEGGVGEGGGCHERDAFSLLQLLARTQKKKTDQDIHEAVHGQKEATVVCLWGVCCISTCLITAFHAACQRASCIQCNLVPRRHAEVHAYVYYRVSVCVCQ